HGVAVGIVGDRGLRQRDEALRSARGDGNRGEHPRQESELRIAHGAPHLDVSRRRIHLWVDRADLARELLPGEGVGLEHDPLLQHDFPERLLRRVEINETGSSACSVTSLVPAVTYCPRSTARIPRRPSKGARTSFLFTSACCSASCAFALFRFAASASTTARLTAWISSCF